MRAAVDYERELQASQATVYVRARCTYADGEQRDWPSEAERAGADEFQLKNTRPRAIVVVIYGGAGRRPYTGRHLLANARLIAEGLGLSPSEVLEYEGAVANPVSRELVRRGLASGELTLQKLRVDPEDAAKMIYATHLGREIAQDIASRLKAGGSDQSVIVLSHSLGASVATDAANALASLGLGIDDLILFDRQYFDFSSVAGRVAIPMLFGASEQWAREEASSLDTRLEQLKTAPYLRPSTVRNIGSLWEIIVPERQYDAGEYEMLSLTAGPLHLTHTPYSMIPWHARNSGAGRGLRRQPESEGARGLVTSFAPSTMVSGAYEWKHGTVIRLMSPYLNVLSRWGLATGSVPRLVPINACRPL